MENEFTSIANKIVEKELKLFATQFKQRRIELGKRFCNNRYIILMSEMFPN